MMAIARVVCLCSGLHPFLSAEESLKSPLLSTLVDASSTRLEIGQRVIKVIG